jgi:hypothetical protein
MGLAVNLILNYLNNGGLTMAYKRLTEDEYTVQSNNGYGWEDVTSETTRKEAKERLKEYRENEPQYSHRLIKRHVKIQ